MIDAPDAPAVAAPGPAPKLHPAGSSRWASRLSTAALLLITLLLALRFVHIRADVPVQFAKDGVLFTDEGWYAANAISWARTGEWYRPHDLNFAVNLPVVQVVYALFFKVGGVNIVSARAMVIFFFAGTLLMTYLLVRRFTDHLTALGAAVLLSTSYYLFAHSRFAISEIPMTFFVLLSVWLATYVSGGRRSLLFAAGSGLAFSLALYTKTSAVFALPLLMMTLWRDRTVISRTRLLTGAAFLGTVLMIVGLHRVALAQRFAEDYEYFKTLNVGLRFQIDPQQNYRMARKFFKEVVRYDRLLHGAVLVGTLILLIRARTFRTSPIVLGAAAWLLLYVGLFSFYKSQPRYYIPMIFPLCVMAAAIGRHLWLNHPRSVGTYLFAALVVASIGVNLSRTGRYLWNPDYSFLEMAQDVERRVRAEEGANPVLLGHFTETAGLFTDLDGINDEYSPFPLKDRVLHYKPGFYLCEGNIPPGSRQELEQTYTITELQTYSVFREYHKNARVHFYRLKPRPDAGADAL